MTDEERKAKRAAYMVQWRANLSRFQKEKKRLQVQAYNKKRYDARTPEDIEKKKQINREQYLKNIDKILAYQKAYREKKKKKNHDDRK